MIVGGLYSEHKVCMCVYNVSTFGAVFGSGYIIVVMVMVVSASSRGDKLTQL